MRSQRLGLNHINYKLTAHYADDRAKAEWKLSAIDQSFHGKVDVPTVMTGNRPIMADLSASNIWMVKLHKVLPPALANIDGRLDGSIKASGTTARPVLAVDIHGRNWSLGPEDKNNDVRLKVDYKERKLAARAEVHLQQSMGKDAGALTAQVELPIDASFAKLQQSKKLVEQLEHKTPIAAVVNITKLDMAKFPFQELGMDAAADARASIDGSLKLRGTMHDPNLDVDVEGISWPRARSTRSICSPSLDYADKKATMKVDASLRGAPILRVRGQSPIDVQRVLDHEPYRDTPVRVDVQVPGFNLVRVQDLVPKIEGQVNANGARCAGRSRSRRAISIWRSRRSNLGEMKYDKFEAQGKFDGAKVTATLDAHEVKGGALAANATLPLDRQAAGGGGAARQRLLHRHRERRPDQSAPVQGQLERAGRRARAARQSDGAGLLEARRRQAGAGGRRAHLRGHQGRRRHQQRRGDAEERAGQGAGRQRHRVGAGEARGAQAAVGGPDGGGAQVPDSDGDVRRVARREGHACTAQQTPDGMSGTVVVEKGTANLPKLAGGKKLQSTGPLEDVKFVDASGAARRGQAQSGGEGAGDDGAGGEDSGAVPRALEGAVDRFVGPARRWRSSGRSCA